MDPLHRPKSKPAAVSGRTEEEIAEGSRQADERIADVFRRHGIDTGENDATRKIKDMEARVAVEGDTDLNHDNVEAAE